MRCPPALRAIGSLQSPEYHTDLANPAVLATEIVWV
jgi:hypothetical protein